MSHPSNYSFLSEVHPHQQRPDLVYLSSLHDLAAGRTGELIAPTLTRRDLEGFIEHLIGSLPEWEGLDLHLADWHENQRCGFGRKLGGLSTGLEPTPSTMSALLTLQHLTQPDAPETLRALAKAGHRDTELIACAVLADIAPHEAVAATEDADTNRLEELQDGWLLLAGLRTTPPRAD